MNPRFSATVKDAHSPAGQPFYAAKSLADLPDCPVCKYGTPMTREGEFVCIDCGAVVGDAPKTAPDYRIYEK